MKKGSESSVGFRPCARLPFVLDSAVRRNPHRFGFLFRQLLPEMNRHLFTILIFAIVLITYRITNDQHQQTKLDTSYHPFDSLKEYEKISAIRVGYLPQGITESKSDMELKPLWFPQNQMKKGSDQNYNNLLAMAVGIKQKLTVDAIVRKFLSENFTIILFHYDGNVNEWHDLYWSNTVIHIAAKNQTKWWFAKRFLHPDVVSMYDYIFLWDEDLGVKNFHPGRYLEIIKSERLEISQPGLDPNLSEIHHRITVRRKKRSIHRRVHDTRGCSADSIDPPCTGWVEGMAPVFSRTAWRCVWHLIQNDLIHGWGMDMKFGYCVQGDRSKKVGVVDSEFIVHHGVPTLGHSPLEKKIFNQPLKRSRWSLSRDALQGHQGVATNARIKRLKRSRWSLSRDAFQGGKGVATNARIKIRRQSVLELHRFRERWDRAAREDKGWVDPFHATIRRKTANSRIV